jgi:hypothetical protein
LPTSSPPTWFETQASVTYASSCGSESSSSYVSLNGRSTIPVTSSDQWAGSTCGTSSAVSIR